MTSKGRVLILSHDDDPHLPKVTKFLKEEPLCINTGTIPSRGLSYHFTPGNPWPEVSYDGRALHLRDNPIKSIWYRSIDPRRLMTEGELEAHIKRTLCDEHTLATHYQLLDAIIGDPGSEYCKHLMPVPEVFREYVASSLNRLAGALPDVIPDAFWVSARGPLIAASSKPRQRVVAAQVGFNMPAAVFTSEREVAEVFLAKHKKCVVKPLAIRPPGGYNQQTRTLVHGKTKPFQGLNVNPHIFEELIVPDFELRIMVVGRKTFASRVWNEDEVIKAEEKIESGEVRDMRAGFTTETFRAESFELPHEIHLMCVELTKRLGLVCGMIDVIVRDGVYYFLEDNGNGQWAFVDDYTVEQIGREMAAMLERAAA